MLISISTNIDQHDDVRRCKEFIGFKMKIFLLFHLENQFYYFKDNQTDEFDLWQLCRED